MNAIEAAQRIAECFDGDGIPYGIGGALALGVWGSPRATKDVDIAVFVQREELGRVIDSLERAGVMVNRVDAARDVVRIGMFQGRLGIIVVDVFVSEHPQAVAMASRLRGVTDPSGRTLSFISAEDLCIHKLLFGRHKDIGDLEGLVAVREIDLAYVRSWLVQMVPSDDRRLAVLESLERQASGRP